mgnify:CR=1 FL=1
MDNVEFASSRHQHLLQSFHATMPGIKGVVFSDPEGTPVAHDVAADARPISAAALAQREAAGGLGASTMVRHDDSLYLVVFLSQQQALAWAP